MSKDLFSDHSIAYSKYRPTYPQVLFDYLLLFVKDKEIAWDCATGNGQAARDLSEYFKKVEATDISEAQIKNAVQKQNIQYHICPAEHTPFADDSFDLITVATAYHWLNWKKFYEEATRVGKANAVVAVWAYNLLISDDERLNKLIDRFYYEIIAPYWDAERKYVDENYTTVEFNFAPLPSKNFDIGLTWNKTSFKGYLSSWSAVNNYIKKHKSSPIFLIEKELDEIWDDKEEKKIRFPLFLRIGRIIK